MWNVLIVDDQNTSRHLIEMMVEGSSNYTVLKAIPLAKMADISAKREELHRKVRRKLPEGETTKTKEEIIQLSTELRQLRREIKVCDQIRERLGHVRENLDIVDRDRQKQKEKSR